MRFTAGPDRETIQKHGRSRNGAFIDALVTLSVAALLSGCAALPPPRLPPLAAASGTLEQVMERRDRIIQLSSPDTDPRQPILVLLHGATEDPTEMMEIAREWSGAYNTFLYSYNHHQHVEKVAADLAGETRRLRADPRFGGPITFLVYSYSAIVFRQAVIATQEASLFSNTSLIQLVPTAGGSALARTMRIPLLGWMAGMASKPSAAENPYGRIARGLWEGEGHRRFQEAIPPHRVQTLLVEGDTHSLAMTRNRKVRTRYLNGIGTNVVVLPKSSGVTHEYFPIQPVALATLRTLLEPTPALSLSSPRATPPALAGPLPREALRNAPLGALAAEQAGYLSLWRVN